MPSKEERLVVIRETLLTTALFLQRFLPLANAHNCDFITKHLWNFLLPAKICDQLLVLSKEKLKNLWDLKCTKCKLVELCSKCSVIQPEQYSITAMVGILQGKFPSVRQKWDKNWSTEWNDDMDLEDFINHVHMHVTKMKSVITNLSEVDSWKNSQLVEGSDKVVHIEHGMTEKKSHEIELMTQFCASVASSLNLTQVVDIGSGRGYLGCQLSLTHKLKVLGVDSSSTNTKSAEKRTSKVKKYWPGLMKKAKNRKSNKPGRDSSTNSGEHEEETAMNDDLQVQNPTVKQQHCETTEIDTETNSSSGRTLPEASLDTVSESANQISHNQNSLIGPTILKKSCKKAAGNFHMKESAVAMKESEQLYVPVTCYVTPSTDIKQLVCDNMPNVDQSNSDEILLTGLHTCGDLASSMLRLFVSNDEAKAICNVGCCYHHIEEEFVCSPFKEEDDIMEEYGFPLSQTLKETRFTLGRNARMLACQSMGRLSHMQKLADISLYWRALLQVILHDLTGELRDDWQVGKIAGKCSDFKTYVKRALVKLKLDYEISDTDIEGYETQYQDYHQKLIAFFQLKAILAPLIELFLLLDRLCFLLEQDCTKDAHLVKLFDEIVSPRCYAIVAMKQKDSSAVDGST